MALCLDITSWLFASPSVPFMSFRSSLCTAGNVNFKPVKDMDEMDRLLILPPPFVAFEVVRKAKRPRVESESKTESTRVDEMLRRIVKLLREAS